MAGFGFVGGGAIDQLRFFLTYVGSGLVAVTGEANDYLEFLRTAIVGTVTVLGGGGGEKLTFETSRAATLSVDLAQGNDQFLVTGAVLDALYANLGDGDDWLDVVGSVVSRWSAVGGAGSDSLGPFAGGSVSSIGALKPAPASAAARESHTTVSFSSLFNLGFEAVGVPLPVSIRETPAPNIHFLVQTLTPIPGFSTSGGKVVGGGFINQPNTPIVLGG
jgi:hypothetical protein